MTVERINNENAQNNLAATPACPSDEEAMGKQLTYPISGKCQLSICKGCRNRREHYCSPLGHSSLENQSLGQGHDLGNQQTLNTLSQAAGDLVAFTKHNHSHIKQAPLPPHHHQRRTFIFSIQKKTRRLRDCKTPEKARDKVPKESKYFTDGKVPH